MKLKLNERFYPLIFSYMEDETSIEKIEKDLSGHGFEYGVFEGTVKKLIDEVTGDDKHRLRKLLYIDPLFNHHYKQLMSNRESKLLKACNYFSYTRLINFKIIERLKSLITHKNRLVAYVAVSALMASKSVSDRAEGLKQIVKRRKISEMAILELIYEFKNNDLDQSVKEVEHLKNIIEDEEVPVDSKAIIILAVEELGYYQLQGFLFSLLSLKSEYWETPQIIRSIILALGKFGYEDATPYIRQCTLGVNEIIYEAGIEALSIIGGFENFDFLISLLSEDAIKNEVILRALLKNGFEQEEIEEAIGKENQRFQDYTLLMDIIKQKPLSV